MKKIFTLILVITWQASIAQCESRSAEGALSLHLSRGPHTGWGGEIGLQGIGDNLSGFLGIDVTPTRSFKGADSTVSLIYVKGLYRMYESYSEQFYFSGVVAPAIMNTDFEFLSGLRFLYVTGRNTAVSAEPLWYFHEKKLHFNINLHFLL